MALHEPSLDAAFEALSDPTRRAVIIRLAQGPATVKDLAEPFAAGLPAFLEHLRVLEDCWLVASEKRGRVRTCRIERGRLRDAGAWLPEQRARWLAGAGRPAAYVETRMPEDDGK